MTDRPAGSVTLDTIILGAIVDARHGTQANHKDRVIMRAVTDALLAEGYVDSWSPSGALYRPMTTPRDRPVLVLPLANRRGNCMSREHQPVEYTEENPIDVDTPRFDSLIHEIWQRCEAATSDLGEFGITMGCNSVDGTIELHFGPNMLVRWDVLAALPAPKRTDPR